MSVTSTKGQRKAGRYRAGDNVAASIILSDVTLYGAKGSLMVRCARMVLVSAQEVTAGGRS